MTGLKRAVRLLLDGIVSGIRSDVVDMVPVPVRVFWFVVCDTMQTAITRCAQSERVGGCRAGEELVYRLGPHRPLFHFSFAT